MANPLPEESRLYQRIKEENIKVKIEIWDLIYHRVGDALSSINLICGYYINLGQSMPVVEAQKILNYIQLIKLVMDTLTKKEARADKNFPEFAENSELHPVIQDMFSHYIPNDAHCISLIVSDAIDPTNPKPIPVDYLKRILEHTASSRAFMERLREATIREIRF